jgi:hypothetical protein
MNLFILKFGLDGNEWWASRPGRFTSGKYWIVGRVCPRASLGFLLQNLKNTYVSVTCFQFTVSCRPNPYRKYLKHTGLLILQPPINQNRIPKEIKSKLNSRNAYYHTVREILSFSVLSKNVNNKNV